MRRQKRWKTSKKGSTENDGNGDNPQLKTEDLAQGDEEPNNQNQQEVNRVERNTS